MQERKKYSYRKAWKETLRAWKIYYKARPKMIYAIAAYTFTAAISPYVTIWFSAQLINELAGGRNIRVLTELAAATLLSTAVMALLRAAAHRWRDCEMKGVYQQENAVYMEKFLDMDFVDVDSQRIRELFSTVWQNRKLSGRGLSKSMYQLEKLIMAVFRILGGIGLSASLFLLPVPENSSAAWLNHPLNGGILFLVMLAATVLSSYFANKGQSYWVKSTSDNKQSNRNFTFFSELCLASKRSTDVRIYRQQENIANVYLSENMDFIPGSGIAKAAKGAMGLYMVLSEAVSVALTGIVYLFVCLKAWAGAFGIGSVTQYVGAISNLFLGMEELLKIIGEIRVDAVFLEPCYEILDTENKMYQGSLTTEKRSDRQFEVEFKDVSYKYPGSDTYALRHVNMKFKVGSRLAVVGMNGSGKTTFIKLLCRLYDPTEGQILLNGIDIRKYRYDDYMNIFSVVFQDFKLPALPLGQNVAALVEYDEKRVEECLCLAGFEERLGRMPKGLNTYLYKDLDKEGVEVSGGEAQKIALARTLYKDAPFIILDEPTAALDPIAEAEVYESFNSIMGDKTGIYISHRLSSCKFCDEIAVFHKGQVVQQGTHEELLSEEKGKYHELWMAQAQYYTA